MVSKETFGMLRSRTSLLRDEGWNILDNSLNILYFRIFEVPVVYIRNATVILRTASPGEYLSWLETRRVALRFVIRGR